MTFFANAFRAMARPVPLSDDLRRIVALPRRPCPTLPPEGWLDRFRRAEGGMTPNETQAAAMYEGATVGGLLGFIGLGIGKGPLGPWLAMAMGAERPVLLVPSPLVAQTEAIVEALAPNWRIPEGLRVVGYGKLSHKNYRYVLEGCDLVVADEAHRLRDPQAAATKRVRAAVKAGARFAGMSGTLLSRSIRDWAHLAAWALGRGSPAPLNYSAREAFAWALDDVRPPFENCPPGALEAAFGPDVREGYRARVAETPGVIVSSRMSCDASITVTALRPKVPKVVSEALATLRSTWTRPDGEEFEDGLRKAEFLREMAQGFWLRWDPPAPEAWLEARRNWHREVRARPPRYDSHGVYEDAVRVGEVYSANYGAWERVREVFKPRSAAVWLDDFLVEAVERWLEGPPGVVWVWYPVLGKVIAARTGLRYYGGGEDAARDILKVDGSRSIICSADSHGEGRNLQMFSRALVTRCPQKADELEQIVGRLHRQGQKADELEIDVFCHTPELADALRSAVENARFVEASAGGLPQRLCAASVVGLTPGQ